MNIRQLLLVGFFPFLFEDRICVLIVLISNYCTPFVVVYFLITIRIINKMVKIQCIDGRAHQCPFFSVYNSRNQRREMVSWSFGVNGPLRQYLSLYRSVFQRRRKKEERNDRRELTASAVFALLLL